MSRKKRNGNGNGNEKEKNSNDEKKNKIKSKPKSETKKYAKTRISITAKSDNQKLLLKSIKENLITIVAGPPGTGKAQPLDSKVYTPDGYKLMKDIGVGDKVSTPDGGVANVVGVFPQGNKDVYRIYFADGDYVECCKEHLWKIKDRYKSKKKYKNKYRVEETSYLIEKLNNKTKSRRFSIDTPEKCFFNERNLSIEPYLMGCLLGDGGITHSVTFSSVDEQILCEVGGIVEKVGCELKHYSKCTYGISSERGLRNDILESLRLYGVFGKRSEEKFIHDDYIYNSVDNRISLLQGLMDTDGTVDYRTGMPSFCTTSYQLAIDLKEIVQSLGGVCVIKNKQTFYTNADGKKISGLKSYNCNVKYNKNKDIFRLNRKNK